MIVHKPIYRQAKPRVNLLSFPETPWSTSSFSRDIRVYVDVFLRIVQSCVACTNHYFCWFLKGSNLHLKLFLMCSPRLQGIVYLNWLQRRENMVIYVNGDLMGVIDNNWVMVIFTSCTFLTLLVDVVGDMGTCEANLHKFGSTPNKFCISSFLKNYVYVGWVF